jgi:putative DNA primase/helicase
VIRGTDYAIWRRIRLVPFEVTIPEAERDKGLFEKLKVEANAIFSWAVQGCLLWQQMGLGEPEEVKAATEGYREEMDVLAEFLQDRCIETVSVKVGSRELFEAYSGWCQENGYEPASQRGLTAAIREKGFKQCRFGNPGRRGWEGLELA